MGKSGKIRTQETTVHSNTSSDYIKVCANKAILKRCIIVYCFTDIGSNHARRHYRRVHQR